MGTMIRAACTKCSYSRELCIGGGMMDWNTDAFIKELPEEGQKEFRSAADNGASDVTIDRKASVCTRCGNIYASSVVSYKVGKLKKTLSDKCPECGSPQKTFLPKNGAYKARCPKCGEPIDFEQTGFWD